MGNYNEKDICMQQNDMENIVLTPKQQMHFCRQLKRGVCKELHGSGLLTDEQLNQLLNELEP